MSESRLMRAVTWDDDAISAAPGLLERRGVHEMREQARAWVRANPQAARALPLWDPATLGLILRAPATTAPAPPARALPPAPEATP